MFRPAGFCRLPSLVKSPYWAKAWVSGEELIALALRLMEEKHLISPNITPNDPDAVKLLATERWDIRTYIVFDVFHDTYDPDTAHLSAEDHLPVISVFLSQKDSAGIAGMPTAQASRACRQRRHRGHANGKQSQQ
ncbi:hypothetical protein ColKHC_03375 [Colletotrichum higginsianum]|nr:hypothetical protein ColKHC_03375 [Colletotrichum higginsianum]